MSLDVIEKQAKYLAAENMKNDPDITEIYWFPDDEEVRLIEVNATVPATFEDRIEPFYFRASPGMQLPAPSGIALIRPSEVRKLPPPKDGATGMWRNGLRVCDDLV